MSKDYGWLDGWGWSWLLVCKNYNVILICLGFDIKVKIYGNCYKM